MLQRERAPDGAADAGASNELQKSVGRVQELEAALNAERQAATAVGATKMSSRSRRRFRFARKSWPTIFPRRRRV